MEKEIKKAPIIGFVRYSQKIDFGDPFKDVFEPSYFEYRFKIFKEVTLKSFQQQTDNNFILLVLHSKNMPIHYKKWFIELQESNSFLHNIFVEDTADSFEDALQNSIDYVSFQNETAVTFRIDNDDAIPCDFIEKMSEFVKKDFLGFVINMPMVYITKRISDQSYMIEECYYPSNSIGLAYVTNRENYKTILQVGQHHLLNNEMPLLLLSKNSGAGLQTINGENAINSIDDKNAKIYNQEELINYLKSHKLANLELNCLRIFSNVNNSSNFSWTNGIKLLIPPIFFLIKRKLRASLLKVRN